MQKKFARFSRLLSFLALGLIIGAFGFIGYVGQSARAEDVSVDEAFTNDGDFGYYQGANFPIVAGQKILGSTPRLQKLKEECLSEGKACVSNDDCIFFSCTGSEPTDSKDMLRGNCVNKKCDCSAGDFIEQTFCPGNLPRCYIDSSDLPVCAECSDGSDCSKVPEPKCDGKTLITYLPTCEGHACQYQENRETCKVDCADGKCVGCTQDSHCNSKGIICNGLYDKVTYKAKCENKTCVDAIVKTENCGDTANGLYPFCYKNPNSGAYAQCVGCLQDDQCEKNVKVCSPDKKSYNSREYSCNTTFKRCQAVPGSGFKTVICAQENPLTPYCQNSKCIQCASNLDCGKNLPLNKCNSDYKTGVLYNLLKTKCTLNNTCDYSNAGSPFKCDVSNGQSTYCKATPANNKVNLSCVQCLNDGNCSYLDKKPTYTCQNNNLVTYGASCGTNNKCNAKGKEVNRQDCSNVNVNIGVYGGKVNLSCLADKGKCGCTNSSQCAGLVDRKSSCLSSNLPGNFDGKKYEQYDKVCTKDNNCDYTKVTKTCASNTVCKDTSSGAKCVGCKEDYNCAYLLTKPNNLDKCENNKIYTHMAICQKDNNNCEVKETFNACLSGCSKNGEGKLVCNDCDANSDCRKPPPAVCMNKSAGSYFIDYGSCTNGKCSYTPGPTVYCNNVAVTSYCNTNNTRIVTGPTNDCVANKATIACVPTTREEACKGCTKKGNGTICSK